MPKKLTEENQLIQQILEGDKNKYRKIVDRYAPIVFHVVRGFVNDEETVQELAQQVFVKTYEKLESFNYKSKFSSWLYMIAKNHCRDYSKNVRRKNRYFSEMEAHELEPKMEGDHYADQEIEKLEERVVLQRALYEINPEYAEAFLMKYRDGMTYKVMAERLNASVSALKVRVHRARKELQQIIRKHR
ncbi:MAG: RNA polymerase sigma factor [Chloroflexota bacterium]|nr:RNA polymerase sigma factor [Chloroflexota bacterium]